ncbi:UDP-N-acetylglucosamine 4,6-dehydratase [Psychrobium sp. 1_MG-2023]|uniref:UDP-N-acetylglucosamine 4,6-dehydratase n=1 Tax=Psychrobium sp. 1_MG-2023 TaxID=3062624 RepID=UPI000C34FA52|nr:UDP-N-acetylglucosamine 4,6-dehydratase [Psychrobium sp. 1_MG-2023]MDP2559845.1 UDP-N-acetylglucosamine 4,6-dehydratase [Psychrobium sp. 1_MG-2023]PKF59051.1 UDP-N-acetylglucosamine 4,6-dehydratase [Alteromonadales bacterium alter-6D02]
MDSTLALIGRSSSLFDQDLDTIEQTLLSGVSSSRFLVLGAAGTIGQAVVKEIFKRQPKKLHAVDLSENNLTELVRDLRSTIGYIDGEFKALTLDIGSAEYDAFINSDGQYDYVLNLSALKHVRSEKDPYTLMRMVKVNILNTEKTLNQSINAGVKKYFCVSTDKAANPVNMMGASKSIMEQFLNRASSSINISTARFANVAFSDGSLLHSFNQRMQKRQPIVAPDDVKRYFVTQQESGQLCLLSCILGNNREIFFPKLTPDLHLQTFSHIAKQYVLAQGFNPHLCHTEDEARELVTPLIKRGEWPCLFTPSDTTGEKDFEEFYTESELLDMTRFTGVGIIKQDQQKRSEKLESFTQGIEKLLSQGHWNKQQIVDLFKQLLPDFEHHELGKYLDGKM